MVDGQGALRVARALASGPLSLRAATLEDARRLLAWRNDDATRAASFDPRPIDLATHVSWLEDRLASSAHHLWVGELSGEPIGVIRFAIDGGTATASVALDPDRRGQGIGTRLISAGCAQLYAMSGAIAFQASIRTGNRASLRAFRHAGFQIASSEPDRLVMRLEPGSVG